MIAQSTAPGPLASYLAGGRPTPNPPASYRRLDDASLREANAALAAEVAPRFLAPDVDRALEREALTVTAGVPPGEIEEALAVRGLLPDELRSPRAFDVALRPGEDVWWASSATASAEATLPFLVPRWPAVSAALLLLDEAAGRLRPWGWKSERHRIVLTWTKLASQVLDLSASPLTEALRLALGRAVDADPMWPQSDHDPRAPRANDVARNHESRAILGAHNLWRARAAAGACVPNTFSIPHSVRGKPFADLPDPFAPLVDVLRLGLGVFKRPYELPQFILLVPREPL